MATPEKISVKFVESLPERAGGGFGGGHAKDLSPIVNALKTKPGVWALVAEDEKSQGALQRLVDFDCEVSTQQAKPREYKGKDGTPRKTFTINIYARYVKGSTAKRKEEAAKKAAAKQAK